MWKYSLGNVRQYHKKWKWEQKKFRALKLVPTIFYQIFIFHQMISFQRLWKMFFIWSKSSFRSWDIQILVYLSSPLFSLSAIALEVDSRKILKVYDVINCLNKNLITHYVWYLENEIRCDFETLSIDRVLNTEHADRVLNTEHKKSCRKCGPKASPRPLFNFAK